MGNKKPKFPKSGGEKRGTIEPDAVVSGEIVI
jgi:hypothetical protein